MRISILILTVNLQKRNNGRGTGKKARLGGGRYKVDEFPKSLEFSFESKATEIIACTQKSTCEPGLFTNSSTVNQKAIFLIEGVFFLLTSPLMGDP
jgi:hypothetical protein